MPKGRQEGTSEDSSMKRSILAATLVLLIAGPGCAAYQGNYSFATTRKFLNSDVPSVTKAAFSPLVIVVEWFASPVTAYMDAFHQAKQEEGHVYLSYIGVRTLSQSHRLDPPYKIFAGILVAPIDTLCFPIAGTIDTIYVLAVGSDEPLRPEDR